MKWMKTILSLSILALSAFAFAGEGENKTISGEIVDLSCYIGHGAKGEKHRKCAEKCLEKGLPMGLLTEDGELYLLIENHDQADAYAKAKEHAADHVEIKGTVKTKNGMKGLYVLGVNKKS